MKKITVQKSSLLFLATLFPASSSTFAKESEEKLYKRLAKCTMEVGKEKKKLKLGGELKIDTYTWCYFGVEMTKLPFCQSKKDTDQSEKDTDDAVRIDSNSSFLKALDEVVEGYIVMGSFDLIIRVEVPDAKDLRPLVTNKIRTLSGVRQSMTVIVV